MSRDLMELLLPRLAKRLNRQLRRYRSGQLSESQFSQRFEQLLQQQYTWLAGQGLEETEAALVVHGAVIVLSGPGLRAEAKEESVPLEIIEFRAVKAAAREIADHYGIGKRKATRRLGEIVACYAD